MYMKIYARASALILAAALNPAFTAKLVTSPKTSYSQGTPTKTSPQTAGQQAAGETDTTKHYSSLAFYVTAHQDDWELFRGQQAYKDLATSTNKVVFIYVTAGDAGRTNGWWEARERGALQRLTARNPALSFIGFLPGIVSVPSSRTTLSVENNMKASDPSSSHCAQSDLPIRSWL